MKKNVLSIKDFSRLLLAYLAIDSKDNNLVAAIPTNYKQIIENILCAENGWKEKFSILINVDEYFEDHFSWELYLGIELKQILNEMGKQVEYSFEFDEIRIEFTKEEIDLLLQNYSEEVKETMRHFSGLLTDYIYTRQFQEKFTDYSAKAVKKMHDLQEEQYRDSLVLTRKKNKKRLF